jgi:hypothetical protein
MQVILEVIPPDGQSVAKLLKLKSMARQNKKHWDKLKNFEIFIRKEGKYLTLGIIIRYPNSVYRF